MTLSTSLIFKAQESLYQLAKQVNLVGGAETRPAYPEIDARLETRQRLVRQEN